MIYRFPLYVGFFTSDHKKKVKQEANIIGGLTNLF